MDSDEEMPYTVSVPGAILAVPPISVEELEDLVSISPLIMCLLLNGEQSSPFYEDSQRHIRYNDLTSDRTCQSIQLVLYP
jgi:hypothetical protein